MPIGLLTLALATAAPAAAPPSDAPPAAMQKVLQSCDAHKFETVITTTVDGKLKGSKVKLCGTEGQTDEAWLRTLRDAVVKTEANAQMAPEVKTQIVSALNKEIARLTVPRVTLPAPSTGLSLPGLRPAPATGSLARDYAALPPMPAPLPATAQPASRYALTKIPRLTLRCTLVGDDRPESCASIDKDTVLLLRADEAFPAGVALRFMRRGDARAEIKLAPMRVGQTAKLRLPAAACKGVVRSRLEIQAVSGAEPAGTAGGQLGEFDLRC